MNSRLGLTLIGFAFVAAIVAAQDGPRPAKEEPKKIDQKKKDELPPIKKLEKKEPSQEPAPGDDPQRIKKIIERLNNNMDSSEERLNKKDPGEETRKVQDQIIKDLDELIKQKNQGGGEGGGGGGGGGGGASGGAGGGGGGGSSGGGQSSRASRRTKKTGSANKGGKGSEGSQGQNSQKKNGSDKLGKGDGGKGGQSAKGGPGKDGKGGGGMGGNPKAKDTKEKSTIADLYKDVWGHLPQNKRQEMDAYAKERFLRKYEEILRQYYRTISEQNRRKVGE